MGRNLRTGLRRRRRSGTMTGFDTLPAPLRAWLHEAALPWSPASALRLWQRALSETGDISAARARLDAIQARSLARDPDSGPGRPAGSERRC